MDRRRDRLRDLRDWLILDAVHLALGSENLMHGEYMRSNWSSGNSRFTCPVVFAVSTLFAITGCAGRTGSASIDSSPSQCVPASDEKAWMQGALDDWERVVTTLLAQDAQPLPWIVLFDSSCTWHLQAPEPESRRIAATHDVHGFGLRFGGAPVTIHAVPHGDSVLLPNGRRIPVVPVAFTSTFRGDSMAFFVMAMPQVWREDPRSAADPFLDDFVRGVMAHELSHTRQMSGILRRLDEIARSHTCPQISMTMRYSVASTAIQLTWRHMKESTSSFAKRYWRPTPWNDAGTPQNRSTWHVQGGSVFSWAPTLCTVS